MLQSRRRHPGPMRSHAILSLWPRGSRTLVAIQKSIQAMADTGARGLRPRSSGFNARGSTPTVAGRFLQKTAMSQYDTTHGPTGDGGCGLVWVRGMSAGRTLGTAGEPTRKPAPLRPNPSNRPMNRDAKQPPRGPTRRHGHRNGTLRDEPSAQPTNPPGNRPRCGSIHRTGRRNGTQNSFPAGQPVEPGTGTGRFGTNPPHNRLTHPQTTLLASQNVDIGDEVGRKLVS